MSRFVVVHDGYPSQVRFRLAIGLIIATPLMLFAGCGGDDGETGGEAPSEITGVVTAVESSSLTEVESFTVKTDDDTYTVLIDTDTDLGFPPAHLNEHRVSGDPVHVKLDERDGDLYALSVEDA